MRIPCFRVGLDLLDGGAGTDTLNFSGFASAVWVNLAHAGREVWTTDSPMLGQGVFRQQADTAAIENVIGTAFADQLRGNPAGSGNNVANRFEGGAGNDLLDGGGGNDSVSAVKVTTPCSRASAWISSTAAPVATP